MLKRKVIFLFHKYKISLIKHCKSQRKALQLVVSLSNYDPTKNKKYLDWVVRNYLATPFNTKQLTVLKHCLSKFDAYKQNLEQRDINQLKSLRGLIELVRPIRSGIPFLSKQKTKQLLKTTKKLRNSACLLHRDKELFVFEVYGSEAAEVLGKGTKWCTASLGVSKEYLKEDKLYVVCTANTKYQLFFGSLQQYCDAQDNAVDIHELIARYPRLSSVLHKKLVSAELWKSINQDLLTANQWHKAVLGEPRFINQLPAGLYSERLFKRWIKKHPGYFSLLPDSYKTIEIFDIAVRLKPAVLQCIPDHFLGQYWIPSCIFSSHPESIIQLNEHWLNPQLCREAVSANPEVLKFLPQKHKTDQLSEVAIQRSPELMKNSPTEASKEELIQWAIIQSPETLSWFPSESVPQKAFDLLLKNPKYLINKGALDVLKYIPESYFTLDIAESFVRESAESYFHLPVNFQIDSLLECAKKEFSFRIKLN